MIFSPYVMKAVSAIYCKLHDNGLHRTFHCNSSVINFKATKFCYILVHDLTFTVSTSIMFRLPYGHPSILHIMLIMKHANLVPDCTVTGD